MELSKTVLATLLLYASVSAQSAPAPADTPNADYQTEVAQRAGFDGATFSFAFEQAQTDSAAGSIRQMDLKSNPFLGAVTAPGVSQFVDTYNACTINVPHVHPRGTEIYYIIDGLVEVGIQEEATENRFTSVAISSGQSAVVPQGLLHYVYNAACTPVSLVQMWNHADPGNVLIYANMVNNFPDAVLQAFTGLDGAAIATLKSSVPAPTGSITQSQACLAACAAANPAAGR